MGSCHGLRLLRGDRGAPCDRGLHRRQEAGENQPDGAREVRSYQGVPPVHQAVRQTGDARLPGAPRSRETAPGDRVAGLARRGPGDRRTERRGVPAAGGNRPDDLGDNEGPVREDWKPAVAGPYKQRRTSRVRPGVLEWSGINI